jgi:hypothetical protein
VAERAILAAKNVDVNELNLKIQHLLSGDLVSYKSIDTVCDATEAVNYPAEFLNSLDLPVTGKFLECSCSKSNARNQLLENEIARL